MKLQINLQALFIQEADAHQREMEEKEQYEREQQEREQREQYEREQEEKEQYEREQREREQAAAAEAHQPEDVSIRNFLKNVPKLKKCYINVSILFFRYK